MRANFAAPIAQPMSAISIAHWYSSTICSASGRRMRSGLRRPASDSSASDVSSKPPGRTRCIGQSFGERQEVHLRRERAVARARAVDLVRVAEVVGDAAGDAARIVEAVQAQRARQVHLGARLRRPRHRGAVEEAGVRDGQGLHMAVVAPVGVQQADGAVLAAVRRRAADVRHRVVGAADERDPRRRCRGRRSTAGPPCGTPSCRLRRRGRPRSPIRAR